MVCLSCVKEGYHAPRQGFLTGIGTGCTEGERGEVTGRRLGPLEGEREREREKALKPWREELWVGAGKKAGWKPRRKEGKAEEKNGGRGRLAWLGITEGMRECLQDKKTTGRLTKTARWK